MSRLTVQNKGYIEIIGCKSLWPSKKSRRAHLQNAIIRLAEYEDAEEQGLLLRLPCKVGDTVYAITGCENISMICDNHYFTGTGAVECPFESQCEIEDCENEHIVVVETRVIGFSVDEDGRREPGASLRFLMRDYPLSDFGKAVFFTREEAERAIKEGVGE